MKEEIIKRDNMKPWLNTRRKKVYYCTTVEVDSKKQKNEEKQLKDLRPIIQIKSQKMLHP